MGKTPVPDFVRTLPIGGEAKVRHYDFRFRGIFGRNRKVKEEFFDLVERPIAEAPLDRATLVSLLAEAIGREKCKDGPFLVFESEREYERHEHGFAVGFKLASGVTRFRGRIEDGKVVVS